MGHKALKTAAAVTGMVVPAAAAAFPQYAAPLGALGTLLGFLFGLFHPKPGA